MLWPRSGACPPLSACVRIDSALAASPHFVRHVSGLCPAICRLVFFQSVLAVPPNLVPPVRASCVCLVCFRHLSTFSAQVRHLPSPLDSFRSWPALGGLVSSNMNNFSAFSNLTCLYCMPADQFSWHSFWLPNSAFGSALYA